MDVSSNENEINDVEEQDLEVQEDEVSGNDYFPEHIPDDLHGYDGYVKESQTLYTDASDYSPYLEDINTTLKFQTAVIIGFLLLVGFIIGWKK